MTSPDPATEGRRRAEELLTLLGADDADGTERLLEGVTEVRDLVFTGAGLTAIARAESRALPPAQRAQANARQERLGILRNANASNPPGLRIWLRRSAEEILLIREQQAIADRIGGADQDRMAVRAAEEASGTAAASNPATTT